MPRPDEAAPALIYKDSGDIILDGDEFDPDAAFPTPVSLPEVPATPDAQDVVDALVTLGLVTQAEA